MSQGVPSLPASIVSVFRLQMTRLVRGKKLRLALVAMLVVIAAIVLARYVGDTIDPTESFNEGVRWGFFGLLVFLVPFLFTSGAIAEEVEARTFTYLAARPVGRLGIAFGKLSAGIVLSVTMVFGALLLLYVSLFATAPGDMMAGFSDFFRTAGALVVLTILYNAVCMFWGALVPEAAGIVSALYLGVIEFLFSLAPGMFRFLSMNYFAQELANIPRGGLMPDMVPEVDTPIIIVVIGMAIVLFVSLSALIVRTSEYRFSKA